MSFWYEEKSGNFKAVRLITIIILIPVILWLLLSTFVTVPAGHRGVVVELGAVKERVLGEGFYTVTPLIQSIEVMEVRTQKYEVQASSATKDLLDVKTIVAVNYHLSPSAVNKLYQEIGIDYENRIIAPAVQEVIKATTATFNAEELIIKRPIVSQQIENTLRERLKVRDINVETTSIVNFEFPEQFNQAIIQKQTAVQLKLKAENDLERIKVEADQQIAKAKGESEAIRIINEQLLKSPQYIQFMAVQKWSGTMPLAVGGSTLPFIQIPV